MGALSDARVLLALARGEPQGATHAERLSGFYGPQAEHYDAFRERLLQGRRELLTDLGGRLGAGARVVELGAGTGRNLEFFGERVEHFERIELVDLCAPLLEQARKRWCGHENVHPVEADATTYRPRQAVDAVYLSYALTMIPDWFLAVDNALAMLAPGGLIAVVDFYVARRHPAQGHARHCGFARHFWPTWFAHDGVRPSTDHLPYLEAHCEPLALSERHAAVPYLPLLQVPYYRFIGQRRD